MLRTTANRAAVCFTFLLPDFKALMNTRIVLVKNATDGGLDQWPVQSTGTADLAEERKREERKKGCGLGYALAANSCEGVSSLDACTVAAPDAITAFAVPKPQLLLAGQLVFSGLVAQRVTSSSESPSLLRTGQYYLDQPFQPSTFTS